MAGQVLIVFSHPAFERSRANRVLLESVSNLPGVQLHDLYERYPDFVIDDAQERALLRQYDAIVAQHPLYWYSCPALFKQWQDLVLTFGFAYGPGGTALQDKPWLSAVTAGGPEEAYTPQGHNRFPIDELLRPLEATALLCGCRWQAPFVVHGSHSMDTATLSAHAQAYRERVMALQAGLAATGDGASI